MCEFSAKLDEQQKEIDRQREELAKKGGFGNTGENLFNFSFSDPKEADLSDEMS